MVTLPLIIHGFKKKGKDMDIISTTRSDSMDQPIMRKRGIYSVIAAILVVGVTTLASLLYIDRMQLGNRLQGRYQKELYDLIGNVQNLETDLSKVSVAFSPQQTTLLFGDIWRQAGAASDRINSLPITHTSISQTSKFLSQVSDFAYSLVRYQNNGGKLNNDQWKTVSELRNNAAYLKRQLFTLQQEMEDGNVGWSEIRYGGGKVLGQTQNNIVDGMFTEIDKQLQKSPTLIYDGPFSENVLNITPRVASEPAITVEQAKAKVADIFGKDNITEIGMYSSKGEGRIPVYPFYVILKGRDKNSPIDIDISKNGGHVVYMLDSRNVDVQTIDIKKGIDEGLKYLEKLGFSNMVPSFTQRTYNILVANYVYTINNGESNVMVYPDQVKVKIALDNGQVIGIEAEKYYTSHTDRNLNKAALSTEAARAKVSPNLKITNTRMALIPLFSKKEVFCYEFVGKRDNTTYIIYINAENGNEEDILQIIETPDGQLAM